MLTVKKVHKNATVWNVFFRHHARSNEISKHACRGCASREVFFDVLNESNAARFRLFPYKIPGGVSKIQVVSIQISDVICVLCTKIITRNMQIPRAHKRSRTALRIYIFLSFDYFKKICDSFWLIMSRKIQLAIFHRGNCLQSDKKSNFGTPPPVFCMETIWITGNRVSGLRLSEWVNRLAHMGNTLITKILLDDLS